MRTGSLHETCRIFPGAGRVFSPDLLRLSPNGRLVLLYTVPARKAGDKKEEDDEDGGGGGKKLELRRVQTDVELSLRAAAAGGGRRRRLRQAAGVAAGAVSERVVFEELCAPGAAADPSFFPDASRFVHQHVSFVLRCRRQLRELRGDFLFFRWGVG